MRRGKYKRLLWLLLFCLLSIFGTLQAEEISQEYRLKAAFLVNFARFITWPEQSFSSKQQEFTICVAGDNPFGNVLSALESKLIHDRKIRFIYLDSLSNIPQCQLLYVSRSEEKNLKLLSSSLGLCPVVTVSDIPGFVKDGGSIEFILKENRLSFIINHSAMQQRGIQASASMLDLAASVR